MCASCAIISDSDVFWQYRQGGKDHQGPPGINTAFRLVFSNGYSVLSIVILKLNSNYMHSVALQEDWDMLSYFHLFPIPRLFDFIKYQILPIRPQPSVKLVLVCLDLLTH